MNDSNQTNKLDQTKQASAEVVDQAKQKGAELAEQVKQQGAELVDQAKQVINESVGEVKNEAESRVAGQKQRAADQLSNVADALRQTSKELHTKEEGTIAEYADSFADQIDRFSNYLSTKEVGDLLGDVQKVARRQPELFVAGALAAGFLIGRFFKSSASQVMPRQGNGSTYYRGYGSSTPYGAASSFDATGSYGSASTPQSGSDQDNTDWITDPYDLKYENPGQESETHDDR